MAKPYSVTEWTRQAVGPLVAAGRCECEHLAEVTDPLTRIDIEAAFLLAVPLVDLPASTNGSCLLAVNAEEGEKPGERRLTGVEVEIQGGEVVSCVSKLESEAGTWATGTVDGWVAAILGGRLDGLLFDGQDVELAHILVESMHRSLL